MTDKKIKELLTSYVGAEMALINEEELSEHAPVYSKSYNKRIRRMFWSEKYFGSRLHVGYMVRRIAIVAMIILGLLITNEVSARVFGVNLWKYTTSFLTDSKMDVKTYTEPEEQSNHPAATALPSIKRDVPFLIPDEFEQTAFNHDDTSLYAEWKDEANGYLQYARTKLTEDMSSLTDGEYQSKERVSITAFAGDYYIRKDETWIIWNDQCYQHIMTATSIELPKEQLIEMVESLYK